MIVYEVVVGGKHVETIRPLNQRPKEMFWYMVDRMDHIRMKYGSEACLYRRFVYWE